VITGFTQGGSNADIVIVDAYLKNITAGIDWNLAYEALIKDAEVEPPNWDIEGKFQFLHLCIWH
jgi:putative alpha-1,2-mannosidase